MEFTSVKIKKLTIVLFGGFATLIISLLLLFFNVGGGCGSFGCGEGISFEVSGYLMISGFLAGVLVFKWIRGGFTNKLAWGIATMLLEYLIIYLSILLIKTFTTLIGPRYI